jgi:hypothetical protein
MTVTSITATPTTIAKIVVVKELKAVAGETSVAIAPGRNTKT